MSGGGVPFVGGFGVGGAGGNNPTPNSTASMRSPFVTAPQQSSMNPQLTGMMNGQMAASNNMVGMGNQMNQPYAQNIQSQLSMSNMPTQGMSVSNSTPSPNQGMPSMNMGTPMGTNTNMGGAMMGPAIGSAMTNTNLGTNMGISTSGMQCNTMTNIPMSSMQQNSGNIGTTAPSLPTNQNLSMPAPIAIINQPQPNKEFNTASLCRFGQETVQDIVSRTQEVFQTLKAIQPPNGTTQSLNSSNEKKAKIQEQLRTIRLLFKRLRLIYEKCNENCQVPGMEYTHIESLIPLKEEYEHNKTIDEKKTSEAYKVVCEENRELTDQVVMKNKQLKEVINNLRTIIWEINVMLTMRRS